MWNKPFFRNYRVMKHRGALFVDCFSFSYLLTINSRQICGTVVIALVFSKSYAGYNYKISWQNYDKQLYWGKRGNAKVSGFSLATQALAHTQYFLFYRENALTLAQAQESKCFSFLVIALMLAFALQQVKTEYRSGITQGQGYLPHVVMFSQHMKTDCIQITSRLNSFSKWRKAWMIWFASNFVFTGVFPIACACACAWVSINNQVQALKSQGTSLGRTYTEGTSLWGFPLPLVFLFVFSSSYYRHWLHG